MYFAGTRRGSQHSALSRHRCVLLLWRSAGPTSRRSTCVGTCIIYQVRHWMHFKKLYVIDALKHDVQNRGRKRWFLSSNSLASALTDVSQRTVGHASIISVRLAVREEGINLQTFTKHLAQGATWCCTFARRLLWALFVCSADSVVMFTCHHAVRCLPALRLLNHRYLPFLQAPSKSEVLKSNLSVFDHTVISFLVFRSGRSFCLQGGDAWTRKNGWSALESKAFKFNSNVWETLKSLQITQIQICAIHAL